MFVDDLYLHAVMPCGRLKEQGQRHVPAYLSRYSHRMVIGNECIKRIRHYGVLANGCKKTQLAQASQALGQPAVNPQVRESVQAFMDRAARLQIHTCPKCKGGAAGGRYLVRGQHPVNSAWASAAAQPAYRHAEHREAHGPEVWPL